MTKKDNNFARLMRVMMVQPEDARLRDVCDTRFQKSLCNPLMSKKRARKTSSRPRRQKGKEDARCSSIGDRLIGQRQEIFANCCIVRIGAHNLKQKGCHQVFLWVCTPLMVIFEGYNHEEAAKVVGCNTPVVGYVIREAQRYVRAKMVRETKLTDSKRTKGKTAQRETDGVN